LFILFFYTQVLGLSGALTGVALAIALVVDAVTDPMVGVWSDNLRRAPLGRRHTLMAASIAPFAGAFAALFNPPAGLTQVQLFVWLLCFAIITRIGITLWTIPFYATGVELSRDSAERSKLSATRFGGISQVASPRGAVAPSRGRTRCDASFEGPDALRNADVPKHRIPVVPPSPRRLARPRPAAAGRFTAKQRYARRTNGRGARQRAPCAAAR
jgi:hypothetical protein